MTTSAEPVDALVETAPDGIDFDGLHVEADDDSYTFETPETTTAGLDEVDLRAIATDSTYVTNWYFWHAVAPQKDDRWAFLRWLEDADAGNGDGDADSGADVDVEERYEALSNGVVTEWGQLRIEATLDDTGAGARAYELRHVDDAGVDALSLDSYDDPLDARDIATTDPAGRYRPLKTAPSLRVGWRFADLGPRALVEAVEAFYPATVPNWHREREGELDVTHWEEAIGRQTGMYGVVKTWNRGEGYEHVNWVADACCDDSQCLKRREWQYDSETALDVDGGDGAFPCREPCSLVVSASRRWTKLEAEEARTYEFELTPSEKEQVEAIIDAVADGRVGEIREADVYEGANRYRTRFLRAKLFDDEGNLAGTPTERDD
jgi:hypothetical protein